MSQVCDTTLRDGEQMPGVVFTPEQKIELSHRISDFGIDFIELMPVVSESEMDVARYLNSNGLAGKMTASTMLRKEHIQIARDCGFRCVTLFTPVSDIHLIHKLGISREENLDKSMEMVEYAGEEGMKINFAGEDSTRADMQYLVDFINSLAGKIERFLPCDTLGCLTPGKTYGFIKALKEECSVPIGLHIHNDFGLATASTLAGLEAGADMFSTTFTGIGERAGNAPFEEVCIALKHLYGIDLGFDYSQLASICNLVSEYSGVELQPHKPVIGDNAFSHVSGIHADGVIKYPGTYENFPPESIGRTRRIMFGKHSGRGALRHFLGSIPDDDLAYVLKRVKYVSESEARSLPPEEVMDIYRNLGTRERGVAAYA